MRALVLCLFLSFSISGAVAQSVDLDNLSKRNTKWLAKQGITQTVISSLSEEDRALLIEALLDKRKFRRQLAIGAGISLLASPLVSILGVAIALGSNVMGVFYVGVAMFPVGFVVTLTSLHHTQRAKDKVKQIKSHQIP